METEIRTHKFGLAKLLVEGWKLYWATFPQLLPILLLVYIPFNMISVALTESPLTGDSLRAWITIQRLLHLLLGTLATVAIAYIIENKIQGQSVAWYRALRHSLSRWLFVILTGLLAGLIIGSLTLLLIVPGIIWSLYYTFHQYVVGLRNIDGKQALNYSKALVKGQWWRVFGYLFVLIIAGFIVGLVSPLPLAFLPTNAVVDVATDTLLDIIGALSTVIWVVFFLNTDYLKQPAIAALSDGGQLRECETCGAFLRPGADFCSSCGARVLQPLAES